jgi:polyphosphate kinase
LRFVNREFSWLQFNWRVCWTRRATRTSAARAAAFPVDIGRQSRRVLHGARCRSRRAGSRRHRRTLSNDGLTPQEQLESVLEESGKLQTEQQVVLAELQEALEENIYIEFVRSEQLANRPGLAGRPFLQTIFPVLTPLSIDPAHPFPFIPNLGFSIALQLINRATREPDDGVVAVSGRA